MAGEALNAVGLFISCLKMCDLSMLILKLTSDLILVGIKYNALRC